MLRALILTVGLLAGCQAGAPDVDMSGPTIGLQRVSWTDNTRQNWLGDAARPLTTTLWYEAEGAEMDVVSIPSSKPIFIGGAAAIDAEPKVGATYPVVLLSHGTGGSGIQMMWLARELAKDGYLVAAVDHHGNTAAEPAFDARGFRMPWQRAQDLSAVIDRLERDTVWKDRVDLSNITAIGFSLGGQTIGALSGGRFDPQRLSDFCDSPDRDATCEPQPEYPQAEIEFEALLEDDRRTRSLMIEAGEDYGDDRIGRFIAIAPAIVQGYVPDTVNSSGKPMRVIVGEADVTTPAKTNAQVMAEAGSADLVMIPGANHLAFLNSCTSRGKRYVPACKDGPTPRAQVQAEAIQHIREFLSQ